MMNE
jgi:hypothetical protein